MGRFARFGWQMVTDIAGGVVSSFTELHRRRLLGWVLLGVAVVLGDYLLLLHMAGK